MELRARMLKPEDVADCVVFVVSLPGRAIVEQLVIRPA
jgi:NADP-dependent 3-hydroxy acid dehydrogenase YdfG